LLVRAKRILLAAGVVLAGVVTALPFRQSPPPHVIQRAPAVTPLALTLRKPDAPLELAPRIEASPASERDDVSDTTTDTKSRDPRTADLSNLAPPPALPVSFQPSTASTPTSDWKPESLTIAPRTPPKPRPYRLRDGDTLEKIAERLLGDPTRAAEIFQSNRDLLDRPDLLPVGVVIKLPPRPLAESAHPVAVDRNRLTPPNN
jgi:nucleoid-associated protein YgaU